MCAFQAVLENNGLEGGAGEIARNDGVGLLCCFFKTCGLWAFQAFFKREGWIGDQVRVMMQAKWQGMMMLVFWIFLHLSSVGLGFFLVLFSSPVIMIAMLLVCRFAGSLSGR